MNTKIKVQKLYMLCPTYYKYGDLFYFGCGKTINFSYN